jgi:hypothetical protein
MFRPLSERAHALRGAARSDGLALSGMCLAIGYNAKILEASETSLGYDAEKIPST